MKVGILQFQEGLEMSYEGFENINRIRVMTTSNDVEQPETDPHQPGAKLDAGKPRAGLLLDFGKALEAVAEVATFGAKKYSDGGWLQVEEGHQRYTDALMRHLFKERYAREDPESKLAHAAHAAWNALARLELMLLEEEEGEPASSANHEQTAREYLDSVFNQVESSAWESFAKSELEKLKGGT